MNLLELREQLKNLNEVSVALIHCNSVQEVVKQALEEVRTRLNVQVASIFLFSKAGVIERVGINGVDKMGKSIDDSWFPGEHYEPGESFSGKAVPKFDAGSGYGQPQFSNTLVDDYSMVNGRHYVEKLGELKCGISVPLNGSYRSFGTLEVLNKCDKGGFSRDDVYWLMIIGTSLANFIASLKANGSLNIYRKLIEKLISLEVVGTDFDLEETYEFIAKSLVDEFTPYKVCIIRIADDKDDLEIKAKTHTSDISWDERKDGSVKAGSQIVGDVYLSKSPVYVENIDEVALRKFNNKEWLKRSNLKSFACLPLSVKDKCVGTISVYTSYNHKFYETQTSFLENIAFLTASIIARVRVVKELRKLRKERNDMRERMMTSSVLVRYDSLARGILHQYKNELINFSQIFDRIDSGSHLSGRDRDFIREQRGWIAQRIQELRGELERELEGQSLPTDMNEAIKEVLKGLSFEFSDIEVETLYDYTIPMLDLDERKVKDIMFNLLVNAEKSIQKASRRKGRIVVETAIETSERIPYVQISVEDNGAGIRKEISQKIFEKGFTTQKELGGTGLGLYGIREILNSYGGKMNFDSTVGKGTKFYIKIPLERYRL